MHSEIIRKTLLFGKRDLATVWNKYESEKPFVPGTQSYPEPIAA